MGTSANTAGYIANTPCSSCRDGFFDEGDASVSGKVRCSACTGSCATCSSTTVCLTCATPANLITKGKYPNAGDCTDCGTACYACTATACTSCFSYTTNNNSDRNYYKSTATACT